MKLTVLFLCLLVGTASAQESGWRASWDATLYGYASHTDLRHDSVLNPDNRIARMAERSVTGELRMNLKAENDVFRLTARPIVLTRETHNGFGSERNGDAYLSQWQLRVRAAEAWNVAIGRDVLNWGPAQFRSPSSPFYFDNGRRDPMRELVGMDSLKLSWTPDMKTSASLVRVFRSGHDASDPDVWRDSWLMKFDQRGNEVAYGLVLAKAPDRGMFYGAHAQATLGDALMFYGEVGSSVLANTLSSPSDVAQPFTVQTTSPRRTTALVGTSYTFENGQSLAAEYLHDGHGYSRAQEDAYFQRAQVMPGMALGLAPRLLGRDYLHLVWQSNLMDEAGHFRLMYTRNLSDGGSELAAYGERVLSNRFTAFAMAAVPLGNARQEFSTLFENSVTLGLKIALP